MERRFEAKKQELFSLYERFERESTPLRRQAFCKAGCSFCCTFMGNIDILTLEGLVILEHIRGLPKESQETLRKKISENMTLKENGQKPPCPFLNDNNTCLIYKVRPFSCRQLYSVRECGGSSGPMAHINQSNPRALPCGNCSAWMTPATQGISVMCCTSSETPLSEDSINREGLLLKR